MLMPSGFHAPPPRWLPLSVLIHSVLHCYTCSYQSRRTSTLCVCVAATVITPQVCGPSYAVQDSRLAPDEAGAGCDRRACRHATAGFEPSSNTIFFYRPSWRRAPSLYCPLQVCWAMGRSAFLS